MISTNKFRFLDISNFITVGHSYQSYLKAFDVPDSKRCFPYEWFDSAEKLKESSLHSAFFSDTHRKQHFRWTIQRMPVCLETWKRANVLRFSDLLQQQKDVTGFLHAINKQRDFFRARGMTFLEDALSPSGLSPELLFQLKNQDTRFFVLFNNKHADLHTRSKQNIVGGPSIVWNRLAVKNGEKKIAHMITPMPKQLKQTWGMMRPRCIDIAWGKTGYFHRRWTECNFRLEKRLSSKPSCAGLVKLCKRFRAYFHSARMQ